MRSIFTSNTLLSSLLSLLSLALNLTLDIPFVGKLSIHSLITSTQAWESSTGS